MRTIFCLAAFLVANSSLSQEVRPTMLAQPPEQDAIKELLDRVSNCCSQQDFRGFMDCFTPSKASSIRKKAEHSFICGRVNMDVLDFFVISASDESISFGLRYVFSEGGSKALYCSKIVAKKVGDSWKIDSEQIKSMTDQGSPSSSIVVANNPVRPRQADGAWRLPDPANGGEEAWLPPDIMYKPGPSCANGNCRVR